MEATKKIISEIKNEMNKNSSTFESAWTSYSNNCLNKEIVNNAILENKWDIDEVGFDNLEYLVASEI